MKQRSRATAFSAKNSIHRVQNFFRSKPHFGRASRHTADSGRRNIEEIDSRQKDHVSVVKSRNCAIIMSKDGTKAHSYQIKTRKRHNSSGKGTAQSSDTSDYSICAYAKFINFFARASQNCYQAKINTFFPLSHVHLLLFKLKPSVESFEYFKSRLNVSY